MPTEIETTRREAQVLAFKTIYQILTYIHMNEEVDVEDIISSTCNCYYEDAPLFVKEITIQTIRHYTEEVELLNKYMNKWTFDRRNRVEQAIMLLSVSHFYYLEETTDKKVIINVAVELAKKYLDFNDYKFVNAVLDNALDENKRQEINC